VKHFAHSTPQTQRRKRGRHFFLSTTLSASSRTCNGFYIDCLRRNGCGKQCPQSCKGRKGHMSPVELSCTCPISVLERFLESRIESCKSRCPASNVPAFTFYRIFCCLNAALRLPIRAFSQYSCKFGGILSLQTVTIFFHHAFTHFPAQTPLQLRNSFNTLSVVSVSPSRGKIFSTLWRCESPSRSVIASTTNTTL
jgi:hypothetical protein